MKINELIDSHSELTDTAASKSAVVLMTRIRLARNLTDKPPRRQIILCSDESASHSKLLRLAGERQTGRQSYCQEDHALNRSWEKGSFHRLGWVMGSILLKCHGRRQDGCYSTFEIPRG